MMELRFMDSALFELAPIPSKGAGLKTDGQFLYYDEDYVISNFASEKNSVTRALLHVVLHCVFSHSFVGKDIDSQKWDLACDMAAENVINEANLNCTRVKRQDEQIEFLSEFGKNLKSYTAERIYARLLNTEEMPDCKKLFFADSHDKWYLKKEPPLHRGTGKGKNTKSDFKHGEATSNSDKPFETRNSITGRWKKLAEGIQVELESRAKEWGDRSGSMIQTLNALRREKHSYTEFLRKFSVLGEVMKIDDDEFDYIFYTYGLKLYDNMPLIEPLEYKEVKRVKEFVIAIDTSGSVQGKLVEKFMQKTYNILMERENFFNKINLHIIQCDTEIKEDAVITSKKEFEDYISSMQLRGFSGTDFRPVFKYVNELINEKHFTDLKGLIYFTDGLGTFPDKKPPYDAAFVFVDSPELTVNVPPWAIKLILDEEDI
ncbi:MAG: metallopeptidase [Christensenellaceae bacterium]|nr:metallopeptidase [Christensenellaceae bacterium]